MKVTEILVDELMEKLTAIDCKVINDDNGNVIKIIVEYEPTDYGREKKVNKLIF